MTLKRKMSASAAKSIGTMRKGTRACQECRRRKLKCMWTSETAKICRGCTENKRTCAKQGGTIKGLTGIEKSDRLKIRVTRIESVIQKLSGLFPDISNTPPPTAELKSNTLQEYENETVGRLAVAPAPPIYALFNNEVVSTADNLTLPLPVNHSVSFPAAGISLRKQLLSIIAYETEYPSVLDLSSAWWLPFQHHYSGFEATNIGLNLSLQDFVTQSLASSSPVHVALGLLSIATSLQTMRPGIDDKELYLSASTLDVMNRLTTAVDQLVLSNDDLIASFEGVVLLLMRGKLHSEANQLGKAWEKVRQAGNVAEGIEGPITAPHGLWTRFIDAVTETDRFFSMFLGLPCLTLENLDVIGGVKGDIDEQMRGLRATASFAAAKINERDIAPEAVAFQKTEEITRCLDTAMARMPSEWWDPQRYLSTFKNPLRTYEHLNARFWFFQTQSFLHLPYLLRAGSDSDFACKKVVCLNASRNLVKIWILLRTTPEMETYLCRLDDFQGLIGSIVILFGLLQAFTLDGVYQSEDLELLGQVKTVLRDAQTQQSGGIARQGLRVLETLEGFLEVDTLNTTPKKAMLFVPYFGAICIGFSGPRVVEQEPEDWSYGPGWDDLVPQKHDLVFENSLEKSETGLFMETEYLDKDNLFDFGSISHDPLFDWEGVMAGINVDADWSEYIESFN